MGPGDEVCRHLDDTGEGRVGEFMVRESGWYSLGLLQRDAPGDRERDGRLYEDRLVDNSVIFRPFGAAARVVGSTSFLIRLTM